MQDVIVSRRITLVLTALATVLLVASVPLLERANGLPVVPALLILAALALGTLAVSRAWTRPPAAGQPSAEGSVAGPT